MNVPPRDRREPSSLMRMWALVTAVALLGLTGAVLSASWSAQVVIPIGVIVAAVIYLFLDLGTPLGRV